MATMAIRDCHRDQFPLHTMRDPNHNIKTNQSSRCRRRKRSPSDGNQGSNRDSISSSPPSKGLVMGQVKILKRGEELKAKMLFGGQNVDLGLQLCFTDRLDPDPDVVQKHIDVSEMYAGFALMNTPSPSSLPFPTTLISEIAIVEGSPVYLPKKILEIAMNEGLPATWPKTAEEIFRDFRGRRAGLIKALTTDARQFYQLCDPKKDLLCLYGLPNGTWKVGPPAEEVPTNIPEPILGINIARDGSSEKDWLTMIALHCDSWLISVAFYIGAFSEIKKIDRDRLFQMINDYPTVLEVVLECAKQPTDHFGIPDSSSIIKSSRKPRQPKKMTMAPKESRQPENHTSMPMKMTMAPKESRQPVNFISMPMKMTMAPKESRQPMNFMSMPMKMTMAPKESRQPVNFISMPMKMTMEPEESRQPMNFINMPMKMTMAPKESRQPVNFISMPMKMTMEPEESRQPMNFINMPMKMTMAPKESRQPVNFISMPMKMTMAPMESRQPMNFISMPMKMTMAPMESRQPVNHTSMPMKMTMAPKEHETRVEVHEGQGITLCGACGKKDGPGEFRICCDTCHKWFHGLCVAMTREDAEHIMHFKCPYCRGKQKLN